MLRRLERSQSQHDFVGVEGVADTNIERFALTIQRKDFIEFKKFLTYYPALLNHPLNSTKQTALHLSIQSDAKVIIYYLLRAGADQDLVDNQQHGALDYANFQLDTALVAELKIHKQMQPLFYDLKPRIQRALLSLGGNAKAIKLLQTALAQLDKFDATGTPIHTAARQFDLYYTAVGIVNAISQATDDETLVDNLTKFLTLRETVLRGDDHDYCYNDTLANQLCNAIAIMLFPNKNPLNVLLDNALKQDRLHPWHNSITLNHRLNQSAQAFFRSATNEIQDYTVTVEKAIAVLIRGDVELAQVWLYLDEKSLYSPLPTAVLNILQQRCHGLAELVQYSQSLANANQVQLPISNEIPIYDHFIKLRRGLLLADNAPKSPEVQRELANKARSYRGTELEAGTSAYLAIAEFRAWWNTLGSTHAINEDGLAIVNETWLQKKIRQVALQDGDNQLTIDKILDTLWQNPGSKVAQTARDSVYFCVNSIGSQLEKMLADDQVKATLYELGHEKNWRISNASLLCLKNKIVRELTAVTAAEFNFGSIFKVMARYLLETPVSRLAQLDYSFFNVSYKLFALQYTPEDLDYIKKYKPQLLRLIFENPQLIPLNPKLTLFTAILFNSQNTANNLFFKELRNTICQKEFVTVAMQILAVPLQQHPTSTPPLWVRDVCCLSSDFFGQLLLQLAAQRQWPQLWCLLNIKLPSATVMDQLLSYVVYDPNSQVLIDWCSQAQQPQQQAYKNAILNFWTKALQQPEIITPQIALVLTHKHFPELKQLFLNAKTATEWTCVVNYIKATGWAEFEENYIFKLLQNALSCDVYVASELLQSLHLIFCTAIAEREKPLALGLVSYCETRAREKTDSGYPWYSIWGPRNGMSDRVKLSAAIKKFLSLRTESIEFSLKEHLALHEGRLGRVLWWNGTPETTNRFQLGG
jgi:hypothetical protein